MEVILDPIGEKGSEMTISHKELMQGPRFEALGKFVYARQGVDGRNPSFMFEFLGAQASIEVDEDEFLNPPALGSMFLVVGHVRRNGYNGAVSLVSESKKFVSASEDGMSAEHVSLFVAGLRIKGVGVVEAKSSTVMNRTTYMKVTLKWQGATNEFRNLAPELFQRIPSVGKYVRFELGLLVHEERNQTGQTVLIQKPSLVSVQLDELVTGSVPSGAVQQSLAPKPAVAGKV